MKLIIDISEDALKEMNTKEFISIESIDTAIECIKNGTPLDDVKAEIEKQIKRDFAFAETETFKVPCHYGTANGLQVAIRIIDNICKAERGKHDT